MHYGYPRRNAAVSEYKVGTLILDVVGAADRQLIWRATASEEVYPDNGKQAGKKTCTRGLAENSATISAAKVVK